MAWSEVQHHTGDVVSAAHLQHLLARLVPQGPGGSIFQLSILLASIFTRKMPLAGAPPPALPVMGRGLLVGLERVSWDFHKPVREIEPPPPTPGVGGSANP